MEENGRIFMGRGREREEGRRWRGRREGNKSRKWCLELMMKIEGNLFFVLKSI
jgi:hypothetical protein